MDDGKNVDCKLGNFSCKLGRPGSLFGSGFLSLDSGTGQEGDSTRTGVCGILSFPGTSLNEDGGQGRRRIKIFIMFRFDTPLNVSVRYIQSLTLSRFQVLGLTTVTSDHYPSRVCSSLVLILKNNFYLYKEG